MQELVAKAEIPLIFGSLGAVSVNALYVNRRQGGRTFTEAGRAYQRYILGKLLREWITLPNLDPNAPYALYIVFYLPVLVNAGWPKTKTRFKSIDASNFVKFFQDCVVKATGVDDANHLDVWVSKRADPSNPRVEIQLYRIEGLTCI